MSNDSISELIRGRLLAKLGITQPPYFMKVVPELGSVTVQIFDTRHPGDAYKEGKYVTGHIISGWHDALLEQKTTEAAQAMRSSFSSGLSHLEPDKFNAILDRFATLAAVVPDLDEQVSKRYPAGSCERLAFEKLKAIVPRLQVIRERLVEERGTPNLSDADKATIHELSIAFQDARAILQETDFDPII